MTQILSSITDLLNSQIVQHRNKPFLKAAMAACALVAIANGKVSLYQRMRIDQIMETHERLTMFDAHDGMDLFNEYTVRFQKDTELTRQQLCEIIKAVIDCEETANCLIQLSQTLIQNNNQASKEQMVINSLCNISGARHNKKRFAGQS